MPLILDPVQSGYNLSLINDNFQRIEDAWDEKLDRFESSQGNQMSQSLDMNNNEILNTKTDVNNPRSLLTVQDGDERYLVQGSQEGLILPAVIYKGGDQIVPAIQVDPVNGKYAINQVFEVDGALVIYAQSPSTLPYTLPAVFPGEPYFIAASVTVLSVEKSYLSGSPDHPAGTDTIKPLDDNLQPYAISGSTYLYRNAVRQVEGVHYNISADRESFILVDSIFTAEEDIYIGFNFFASAPSFNSTGNVVEWVLPDVASFSTFPSSEYPDLKRVTTQQHTSHGIGAASYIKVDSGAPDAFGFVVQDGVGQLWMIDTKTTGELFFEQLGALPTTLGGTDIGPIVQKAMQAQNLVGCVLNHEASGEFLFTSTAGPMMSGENSTRIIVDKPIVKWNGFSSTEVFTMLEAPLVAAEGVRVEGLTLIPSLQTEAVVPNPITDPEGYRNAVSWGIDWSRCRNGSHLSNIRFVAGGNGIVATDLYYSAMSDIDLRGIDSNGVGLLEYALSSSTQVNGVNHRNVKLHNGRFNLLCIAADGVACDANVYDNVYLENSVALSAYFKGWRNTIMIAPYFENNSPSVLSAGTTDIFARDSSITILGGLINSVQSGATDSFSVAHEGIGFIKFDGGVRLNKGNRAVLARGNIIWGDSEGIDFTIPGSRNQLASMREGNTQLIAAKTDSNYDSQTTLPLAYTLDGDSLQRVLWVVDLNTTQFRESWVFDVDITSTTHGAPGGTSRQGCVTMRITVRKEGSTYTLNTDDYGLIRNLSSDFGTWSAFLSGSEVLISFSPSGNLADTRAVLNPILCGSNLRVSEIKEGY